MKKLNALKLPLSFLLLLSLVNCTPEPPDVPVCEKLSQRLVTDPASGHLVLKPSPTCQQEIGESECGHCVYIISKRSIFVGETKDHLLNKKPWSQIQRESVYVPAVESYAPISQYIINSCKKMNCNDQVDRFRIKLDSLNGIGSLLPDSN